MSWDGKGSARQWRKTRARILARDGYMCRIKGPKCLGRATTVHHVLGRGISEADEHLLSACVPCNNAIGDPMANDPEPIQINITNVSGAAVTTVQFAYNYPME